MLLMTQWQQNNHYRQPISWLKYRRVNDSDKMYFVNTGTDLLLNEYFTWSKFVQINVHRSVLFSPISVDLRQMLVCLVHPYMDKSWRRHQMGAFSTFLALCAGNSPVTSEFPAQRPVTRSFDVFYDLRLYKRLSKQSWGWWFETPSRP